MLLMNYIIETGKEERLGFINLLDIHSINQDKETQRMYNLVVL